MNYIEVQDLSGPIYSRNVSRRRFARSEFTQTSQKHFTNNGAGVRPAAIGCSCGVIFQLRVSNEDVSDGVGKFIFLLFPDKEEDGFSFFQVLEVT
ncbi:hypothetical protein EL17_23615 [Anditalea andensis]|uniref:Uncharacterized protein n=1 Tax=Anditalea andensis TaxID=1048983 RepID=A0A074KRZ4_9BACT|nr:hypothetical protein EL17_23615 [Anditalea andensis]